MCSGWGDLWGITWFYSSAFEVNSFSCALLPFTVLGDFAPCPLSLSGKYKVSIMVPLFFSVTVPGGCRSQGCHGYFTHSTLVPEAPPSFQASSPSSSTVDEFNCPLTGQLNKINPCLRAKILLFHIQCSSKKSELLSQRVCHQGTSLCQALGQWND